MSTLRETFEDHGYDGGWRCSCGWTGSYDEHAAHLEAVVLAWVGARLAGARGDWNTGARAAVAAAMVEHGPDGHVDGYEEITDAALGAFCEALGVPVAPAGGEVAPEAAGGEIGRENGAEGCAACPFAGCDRCPAEATRRANGGAK